MLVYLILLAVSGLLVGALARLALPGPDPMSLLQTMAIGIAGTFAAGLISLLVFGRNGGGIRGGSLTEPYAGYRRRGVFGNGRR